MTSYFFISLLGILILLTFGIVLSGKLRQQNWRLILAGTSIQLFLGWLIFQFPGGMSIFSYVNSAVNSLADIAATGSRFLFGTLALPPGSEGSMGFFLAFQALPTIVFFSAFIGLLYHIGFMPILINFFSKVFTRLFRTSGAESMVAASSIFVGVEAMLTIRPFLLRMTRSELHTVLTAGLATVSSNVMALYIFTLRESMPSIAGHLVTASILSAPAALVFSKVLLPETETPETLGTHIKVGYQKEGSFIEAIVKSSLEGLKLITGIVALLLSVLGLVGLIDVMLGWVSGNVFGIGFTLKDLFSYLFYPLILVTGVPFEDVFKIAGVVGERLIVTEVVSYQDLAQLLATGAIGERSAVIATYALCGFTHFASLAIFAGAITAIVPERTKDVAAVSLRSLVAATFASLMTACVAGVFYSGQSLVF
ncbi:MAG: nucleoside transporter [Leptonema sp. (in: Bacteria)]|nr:nucleoside transporter [Leptonema sp. (in: bacteria)]